MLHVHKDKYFRSILSERETKDDKGDMYFGENSLDAILLAAGGAIKVPSLNSSVFSCSAIECS